MLFDLVINVWRITIQLPYNVNFSSTGILVPNIDLHVILLIRHAVKVTERDSIGVNKLVGKLATQH